MNTKRTESLLLDVSSESEIMYIFMHKMHWCTGFFFSLHNSRSCIHTSRFAKIKKEKNVFVFYRLCAPLNGLLYHMKMLGWEVRRIRRSQVRASLHCECRAYVENVCADYIKFVQLAITSSSQNELKEEENEVDGEHFERKSSTVQNPWIIMKSLQTSFDKVFKLNLSLDRRKSILSSGWFSFSSTHNNYIYIVW